MRQSKLKRAMELFKTNMEKRKFRVKLMANHDRWGMISVTIYEKDNRESFANLDKQYLRRELEFSGLEFATEAVGSSCCSVCGGPGRAYYSDAYGLKRSKRKKFSVKLIHIKRR